MNRNLPPLVEQYLEDVLVGAAAPLALSFDRDWNLTGYSGYPVHYALDLARPETSLAVLRDLFLGIALGEPQAFPYVELPGGKSAHVHLIPDGDGFHLVLLDATADTARQRSLQQLGNVADLARHERGRALKKLKKVHTELEAQHARLEEADRLKGALMATLSHEFRTPLTAIFGYLHLLERGLAQDERYVHPLRAIKRSAMHLFALAENLLEYARGESGGSLVEVTRLDLARLGDDLRDMFAPIAQEQQLSFSVAVEAQGISYGDELKLRQILINLVSNALRYTPKGGVTVRITGDGDRIGATVRDTGVGIAREHQAAVFEAFNRALPRGSKGAGLGLSIARGLAEQMGGTLKLLASEPGGGSTFALDLPSPPPVAAAPVAPAGADAAPARRAGGSALLADDDADVRELLRVLLTDAGYAVYLVGNANDAFQYALAHQPDLCVVDVQMPGLSGNAAVYKLRANGYRGRVITLSATPTAEARAAALAAGADAFVTKPIDLAQFNRLLHA